MRGSSHLSQDHGTVRLSGKAEKVRGLSLLLSYATIPTIPNQFKHCRYSNKRMGSAVRSWIVPM